MKPEIHPEYVETPFYTGKQRILDTGGRVAKFEERFGKKSNSQSK
ncbi:MAG: 50S ribosomal protein L31 [Actinobacteria bacterium]|nr:50S ribosomal protein L31 [Actinomycetota bacterium]